jgi:hypothetical protein
MLDAPPQHADHLSATARESRKDLDHPRNIQMAHADIQMQACYFQTPK